MKRTMQDRISDFMAGKGFYIVLLLCVTALGVSGYYLFSGISEPGQSVSGPATVVVTAAPTPVPTAAATPPATATPRPTPTAAPIPEAPAQVLTTPTPEPTTATASVFTWPVKGEVLRAWSVETLVYDQTMGDWRTHDGVDIASAAGTQVMAPAGGTVSDLYTDDLMGTTVVILHADGVMSTCSNLASVPTVEIGDTVRTGDVIGSVGTSAIAESAESAHLHLSMTKDGVSVDPLGYLPEQ
ncbi:MAG: M23 family metallopeptidase [Oscillospiraceae bacterium]|nr:M23 family metallopeptidase [Oscillospiraceae bacterium]